ncbi:hypothetical protein DFH09DRAFT_1168483 [Mycena vulgaris]|nr:hypothetical protein DFH09DRAFT_1168483 [Mycena vulgaris]
MDNETSSRTAIDLVLLTAIDLAQQQIAEKQDVDEALRARHSLNGPKLCVADGREVGSWVVLHQEVDIPGQPLLPGLALHGILDYLIGVVAASDAVDALSNTSFLTTAGLYANRDVLQHSGKSLASVQEAKSWKKMDSKKAWAQVTAQGAALCVLTKRPSVINTLTDGVRWQFVRVTKIPDQDPPSQPRKTARSNRSNQPASTSAATSSASASISPSHRRTSQRLAPQGSAPPTVSEKARPFKATSTRLLNIFEGRDLEIILQLLTLSILSSPQEFEELAVTVAP